MLGHMWTCAAHNNCVYARAVLRIAMTAFAEQELPDWHRMASNSLEALTAFCEGED
jgi:hypothetical protein